MDTKKLNEIYYPLHEKATEILFALHAHGLEAESGWFNGHYSRGESGEYKCDYFPIPVISVKGICDIEIGLDKITLSCKLKRDDALTCDFGDINIPFEAFGVVDYLSDYYVSGMTIEDLRENIRRSDETEIGFCFIQDKNEITDTVKLLQRKGFYY